MSENFDFFQPSFLQPCLNADPHVAPDPTEKIGYWSTDTSQPVTKSNATPYERL